MTITTTGEPPIFDDLTLALDAHLVAHGAMLRAVAASAADVDAAMEEAALSWQHFLVILTERSTSMAAGAANGVVRSYTRQMLDLAERVTALERVAGQVAIKDAR